MPSLGDPYAVLLFLVALECGRICIVASLFWLWAVERMRPDHWDALDASTALIGAAIDIFGAAAGATSRNLL